MSVRRRAQANRSCLTSQSPSPFQNRSESAQKVGSNWIVAGCSTQRIAFANSGRKGWRFLHQPPLHRCNALRSTCRTQRTLDFKALPARGQPPANSPTGARVPSLLIPREEKKRRVGAQNLGLRGLTVTNTPPPTSKHCATTPLGKRMGPPKRGAKPNGLGTKAPASGCPRSQLFQTFPLAVTTSKPIRRCTSTSALGR